MVVQVPNHLCIDGRSTDQTFMPDNQLYRSFQSDAYDTLLRTIKVEQIRFPDISFNWDRYSDPPDVMHRENGRATDGCYSITVETSRYKETATPVHDPIDHPEYPNYAHVEVRVLKEGENSETTTPEKGRRLHSKARKLAWRSNIANMLRIEIMAST